MHPPRRKWSQEEDDALKAAVHAHPGDWPLVSQAIKHRTPKQCRNRWENKHVKSVHACPWTEVEERRLIELHQLWGCQWQQLAQRMEGRTANNVKNHWNTTLRRRDNITPLKAYIHSLAPGAVDHPQWVPETPPYGTALPDIDFDIDFLDIPLPQQPAAYSEAMYQPDALSMALAMHPSPEPLAAPPHPAMELAPFPPVEPTPVLSKHNLLQVSPAPVHGASHYMHALPPGEAAACEYVQLSSPVEEAAAVCARLEDACFRCRAQFPDTATLFVAWCLGSPHLLTAIATSPDQATSWGAISSLSMAIQDVFAMAQ